MVFAPGWQCLGRVVLILISLSAIYANDRGVQPNANKSDKARRKFKEKEAVGRLSKFVPWCFDLGFVLTDAVKEHKSASTAEPQECNHNSQSNQQAD